MIKCLAYVKKESSLLLWVQTVQKNENKEASEGKCNLVFTTPEALLGGHRSTILTRKNKIEAVFIDEVHCVAK